MWSSNSDYWITSFTRASNDLGMVMPSALAVFMFKVNSNRVGCSTGKSAGLAPPNILATKEAAFRKVSVKLAA